MGAFPNPVCGVRTKALRGNSGASPVRFVQRGRRRELPEVILSEPGLTPSATCLKRAGGEKLNCESPVEGLPVMLIGGGAEQGKGIVEG